MNSPPSSDAAKRSLCPTVSTNALGVEDFAAYQLIIDARTPREFDEDHVPGAVNLPVVTDSEFAEVGIEHARDPHAAYLLGAEYASRNLAGHIRSTISQRQPGDRLLVYCFRGGKRSRVWADTLRNIGFDVDVVKGGWKTYRRWVRDSLEALGGKFDYRVLSSLTGCGKTRLLHALKTQGNQVLDLEGIAAHRGSLLGEVPGQAQPTQKLFDSLLLKELRAFDIERPVWVEAEGKKIGNVQLPDSLYDAIRSACGIELSAPMAQRVRLLQDDYPHFTAEPSTMVDKLQPLKPLVGGEALTRWRSLAVSGDVDQLFEQVLTTHYDPSYLRSRSRSRSRSAREPEATYHLADLDAGHLAEAASELTRLFAIPVVSLGEGLGSATVSKPGAIGGVRPANADPASSSQAPAPSTNAKPQG